MRIAPITRKNVYVYISVFLLLALIAIHLFNLSYEYDSMGWTIQHDEKLSLSDARAFYLKGTQKLTDYTPAISSSFGVLGPRIGQAGFNLFGFNNYGLRLPFLFFSASALCLLVFCFLKLNPGGIGFLLSLVHILSYKYFILLHYAIAEDVLILFMVGLVWIYIIRYGLFIKHINKIIFACSALFLIKQNFPFLCLALIGFLLIAAGTGWKKLIRLFLVSVGSLLFYFFIQIAVLKAIGLWGDYFYNMARVLCAFNGNCQKYFSTQKLPDPPAIFEIIPRYFELMTAWYLKGYVNTLTLFSYTRISLADKILGNLSFALIYIVYFLLLRRKKLSKLTFALGLFLIFALAVSSKMFLYIKRAVVFFPVSFIFLSALYGDLIACFSSKKTRLFFKVMGVSGVLILLSVQTINQYKYLAQIGKKNATCGIKDNSRDLDNFLPKDAVLYAHCYGFRFFWQSHHRIISADDQIMNNQMIMDKALKEKGRFVLLSIRGGECTVAGDLRYKINTLKEYKTEISDSGYPEQFTLLEIIYTKSYDENTVNSKDL